MSRLLIFDSKPRDTTKSDGTEIGNQFALGEAVDVAHAKRTNPVRCFGGREETRILGIEWLLDTALAEGNGTQIFAFRWWTEFYNDKPALASPPSQRNWPGVNNNTPWARGMVINDGGGGNIDLNPITYRMNMTDRLAGSGLATADCLYVPLTVHTLWARAAIYCDLASSTNVTQDQLARVRLRAFAIVGNHAENQYLDENAEKIYAYNAFKAGA